VVDGWHFDFGTRQITDHIRVGDLTAPKGNGWTDHQINQLKKQSVCALFGTEQREGLMEHFCASLKGTQE